MANKFGFTSVNEQVNLGVSNNTGQVQDQIDLLNQKELEAVKKKFPTAIFVSAEARTNIEELRQAIEEMIP